MEPLATQEKAVTPIKASFNMELRGERVHVEASIDEFGPEAMKATVQVSNLEGQILEWPLNREELIQVFREAAKVKRSA